MRSSLENCSVGADFRLVATICQHCCGRWSHLSRHRLGSHRHLLWEREEGHYLQYFCYEDDYEPHEYDCGCGSDEVEESCCVECSYVEPCRNGIIDPLQEY